MPKISRTRARMKSYCRDRSWIATTISPDFLLRCIDVPGGRTPRSLGGCVHSHQRECNDNNRISIPGPQSQEWRLRSDPVRVLPAGRRRNPRRTMAWRRHECHRIRNWFETILEIRNNSGPKKSKNAMTHSLSTGQMSRDKQKTCRRGIISLCFQYIPDNMHICNKNEKKRDFVLWHKIERQEERS